MPTYSFSSLNVPGATDTEAYAINNAGQIVGPFIYSFGPFIYSFGPFIYSYSPSSNLDVAFVKGTTDHGFVKTGGSFAGISVPGAISTETFGINNAGQIVGTCTDGLRNHGFVDTAGIFAPVDVPGATDTILAGINNAGQIVGTCTDGLHLHGFVDIAGAFTPIDVPGATDTAVWGINDHGKIVGTYLDSAGHEHGFFGTPPPSTGDFLAADYLAWGKGGTQAGDLPTLQQYIDAAASSNSDPKIKSGLKSWKAFEISSQENSTYADHGMYADAFLTGDGQIVIAFKATKESDLAQLGADWDTFLGKSTKGLADALARASDASSQ